jgi:hypothetical protein
MFQLSKGVHIFFKIFFFSDSLFCCNLLKIQKQWHNYLYCSQEKVVTITVHLNFVPDKVRVHIIYINLFDNLLRDLVYFGGEQVSSGKRYVTAS